MLKLLRSFVDPGDPALTGGCARIDGRVPGAICLEGLPAFRVDRRLALHHGIPLLDWEAAIAWLNQAESEEVRAAARDACTRAWLLHVRDALGTRYSLDESGAACLLSTLDLDGASAILACMNRTLVRAGRVLQGVAHITPVGREIVIMFDDGARYRDYVRHYHPGADDGPDSDRAVHITAGCSHHAVLRGDPAALEPLIVHAIVRGCTAHLPHPLWLREGLALTAQRRLAGEARSRPTPGDLHDKHGAYWGEERIQEFWSGASFTRSADARRLSRDLARLMVEQMAEDWPRFLRFAQEAEQRDAAAASAQQHLGMQLGEVACQLLDKPSSPGWAPDPGRWQAERGSGADNVQIR